MENNHINRVGKVGRAWRGDIDRKWKEEKFPKRMKEKQEGKEGNKEFIAHCQMQMYWKLLKKTRVLRTGFSFLNGDILKNLKIFLRQTCWAAMNPSEEPSSLGGQAGYSGYLKGHVPKLKQVNCTLNVEDHKAEPDTQWEENQDHEEQWQSQIFSFSNNLIRQINPWTLWIFVATTVQTGATHQRVVRVIRVTKTKKRNVWIRPLLELLWPL